MSNQGGQAYIPRGLDTQGVDADAGNLHEALSDKVLCFDVGPAYQTS